MGKLLDDIEAAATTSAEPLTDLLRRCKVLAARLKHAEFANWVSRELNGYENDEEVPPYRVVSTPNSIGSFVGAMGMRASGVPLPLMNVPEGVREKLRVTSFRQSVAALQELATNDRKGLQRPWDANLIAVLQAKFMEGMMLVAAHADVPPGAVSGILDTVRTRVLDFVLAIKAQNPEAGESPPNAAPPIQSQTVTNVFNSTIIGGHANIGTSGNATIDNSDAYNSFVLDAKRGAELESLLSQARNDAEKLSPDERETALATLNDVAAAAKTNRLNPENIKNWTTALTGVSGAVTAGSTAAPHIVDLVHWLGHLAAAVGHAAVG